MSNATHTHWGMVINNYDETDLALLELAYPDHIRKLVYTKEVGKEGTPHIQAFIKMKRDCRLSHMKKLFPKGHFNYLDTLEYKLNAEKYAQKQDETSLGASVIVNGDPIHTIEGMLRQVVEHMITNYEDEEDLMTARRFSESDMVREDYTRAKTFVSSTYKTMWRDFGGDIYNCLFNTRMKRIEELHGHAATCPGCKICTHTHTHTHTVVGETPPPKSYVDIGTQTDEWDVQGESDDEEELQGSDEEDDDASSFFHEDSGEEDCQGSDCS